MPRRGYKDSAQGFNPGNPKITVRPHKEHGGITRDVGGGNCALSWLQRLFSCSDRSELIAQLAGGRIEAVEAALLMGLFQSSKDTHIKSDLVSDQVPDDSGKLLGHGRNGLGSTQFSAQASVLVAQIAFIMMQRAGCHAQRLANAILAAAGPAVEHFTSAGFVIRTQTQP